MGRGGESTSHDTSINSTELTCNGTHNSFESATSTPNPTLEESFLRGAEARGLLGLKGHRSVGGIRASNYNAVSVEGVRKLAQCMEKIAISHVV